jgi:hypothetical protein
MGITLGWDRFAQKGPKSDHLATLHWVLQFSVSNAKSCIVTESSPSLKALKIVQAETILVDILDILPNQKL